MDTFARRLLELTSAHDPATRGQAAATLGTLVWEKRLSPEDRERVLSRLADLTEDPEKIVRDAIWTSVLLLDDEMPEALTPRVDAFIESYEP